MFFPRLVPPIALFCSYRPSLYQPAFPTRDYHRPSDHHGIQVRVSMCGLFHIHLVGIGESTCGRGAAGLCMKVTYFVGGEQCFHPSRLSFWFVAAGVPSLGEQNPHRFWGLTVMKCACHFLTAGHGWLLQVTAVALIAIFPAVNLNCSYLFSME